MDYMKEYSRWLEYATDLSGSLNQMKSEEIEDAFYRDLEFGTGGLRGVIGAGTNRMNVYTVAKASQGLADYVNQNGSDSNEKKIAIAYDSRNFSDVFSRVAASVFASNGIHAYIYPELMPTPCLSFAVRYYGCDAGIVITASHNPAKYNGYKVYGNDGCQITTLAAERILSEIEKLDIFVDVKRCISFEEGIQKGLIHYISDDCTTAFIEEVKKQSVLFGEEIRKDVAIVYSPLHGTGLKPVTRALQESGYTNITIVKEQEKPDGDFPTCPYPNPEIRDALSMGLAYAQKYQADLMLATDPDCDRVGIAVKDGEEMKLLTGNEVGMLLLEYICTQRMKHQKMPCKPVMVKTIVTIDMADRIAAQFGVETINVLTGFKFIGEQIGLLEKKHEANRYIFGFEESYGYLSGSYVRDKDAVNGAFLICEMFAYYKTKGISLIQKLEELYRQYGYCLNTLHSYEFPGSAGFATMKCIMEEFRKNVSCIGGKKVERMLDYAPGLDGLPKSDVLKFLLEDHCSVVIRPSGTEPKIKTYISVSAPNQIEAIKIEKRIAEFMEGKLQ